MKNNDLSNLSPRRIIVTIDVIATPPSGLSTTVNRRAHRWGTVAKGWKVDRQALGHVLRYAERHMVMAEIAAYGINQEEVDAFMDWLDRIASNPFSHGESYTDPEQLMHEVVYRPEIIGIVDVPSRALRYGSYYLSLD